jgi:purine nucleoside permease
VFRALIAACVIVFMTAVLARSADAAVIRPKVVIVAFFEVGKDTGDRPGELQYWVERDHLTRIIDVPGMTHHVRANADGSEIALAVGPAQIRPAVNLTVLGFSPLFDLRRSYWLINGIAGASPRVAALGDAFWADYVVNGGYTHAIDSREIPASWPDGIFWIDRSSPSAQRVVPGSADDPRAWPATGAHSDTRGIVVRMNPSLLRWAYAQTRTMTLATTAAVHAAGRAFPYAAAHAEPRVREGGQLATEAFAHGARYDAWARRWVPYATDGLAQYATAGQNDSGALNALYALTLAGRADWNRALLLRTVSNYDMPPPGMTAAQSIATMEQGSYSAYLPALEAAYAVGHRIVRRLIDGAAPAG